MVIDVNGLIELLKSEFEGEEQVLLFNIKVKKQLSTRTITNPEYPKEEERR